MSYRKCLAVFCGIACAVAFSAPRAAEESGAKNQHVRQLVERLASASAEDRARACIELRTAGPDAVQAIPQLASLLNDSTALLKWRSAGPASAVRQASSDPAAFRKTYRHGRLVSIVAVVGGVEYPTQETTVGTEAALTLRAIGRPAMAALIEAAKKPEPARYQAAFALGPIDDPQATEAITIALSSDNFAVLRRRAPRELAEIGSEAVYGLYAALASNVPEIRKNAYSALRMVRLKNPAVVVGLRKQKNTDGIEADLLSRVNHPGTVEAFTQLLGGTEMEYYIRATMIEGLAHIHDPRSIDALLQASKDSNPTVRKIAVAALRPFRAQRLVEPLLELLKDANKEVQAAAAEALLAQGHARAGEIVLDMLLRDEVRDLSIYFGNVTRKLGERQDSRLRDRLMAGLKSQDPKTRGASAWLLGQLGDARAAGPISSLLKDSDDSVKTSAIGALDALKSPVSIDPLVQAANASGRLPRLFAVRALAGIDDPRVVAPLVGFLKDPDEDVRASAALGLGQSKVWDARILEALTAGLKDQSPHVRMRSAEALGTKPDPAAARALVGSLEDKSEKVVVAAARALRTAKTAEAVAPLVRLLAASSREVQEAAARSLGGYPEESTIEALLGALNDKSSRWSAAQALAHIRNSRSIDKVLADAADDVRVAQLFAQVEDPPAHEGLLASLRKTLRDHLNQPYPSPSESAVRVLARMKDPRALPLLIDASRDSNTLVRKDAVTGLGNHRDPRALEALFSLFEDGESTFELLNLAAVQIKGFGAAAVEPLIAGLKGKNYFLRMKAAELLGDIGDPRGVAPLLSVLQDDAAYVRYYAEKSLARLKK